MTTKRKHHHEIADNLLNQQFNPTTPNVAWAGDVTYLRTNEGWMYLAIVMDLYSRKIIGCSINKRMTTPLVMSAMEMAINLRQPGEGVLFHSDRGSQYTSKKYRKLLSKHKNKFAQNSIYLSSQQATRYFGKLPLRVVMRFVFFRSKLRGIRPLAIEASMSSVGACLDNAPVERFFGSLKNEWLLNVVHLTRESMAEDVKAYIRYYNHDRLHTANEYLSPVNFENSRKKVSCLT
ncbi:putative transposase OrfB [Piscirickettsia salmonis]|nr:putative transposase OrfB [Piscirickettsia salmonis]QGP61352.1 putative transposase OrfB [Piscirickettsia salmonis]QGP66109.1 putative transposase OrfB [Piscirickettsia salmonis]